MFLRTILAATAALLFAVATGPASAVDLGGMALTAQATEDVFLTKGVHGPHTMVMLVYFGTKGDRFAMMGTGVRVVIPAGKNSGSANLGKGFNQIVTLDQSANALNIRVRSTSSGGYDESRFYEIALSPNGCTVIKYRHTPDHRLSYTSQKLTPGPCTLTKGQPDKLFNDG